MSEFLTELVVDDCCDAYARLVSPLSYESDLLEKIITVPVGFETDFASVPRVPIVYWFWGGRAHREAVLHDYLYRIDSDPVVSEEVANKVFFEAMQARGKGFFVRWPMYWGVCLGGWTAYHKKLVADKLI